MTADSSPHLAPPIQFSSLFSSNYPRLKLSSLPQNPPSEIHFIAQRILRFLRNSFSSPSVCCCYNDVVRLTNCCFVFVYTSLSCTRKWPLHIQLLLFLCSCVFHDVFLKANVVIHTMSTPASSHQPFITS